MSFPTLQGAVVVMIVQQFDFQLPIQSVPITTNVASSNPTHGEVYPMQHYKVLLATCNGSVVFSRNTEIVLKVALNTTTPSFQPSPLTGLLKVYLGAIKGILVNLCRCSLVCFSNTSYIYIVGKYTIHLYTSFRNMQKRQAFLACFAASVN